VHKNFDRAYKDLIQQMLMQDSAAQVFVPEQDLLNMESQQPRKADLTRF
jgi:hypothetical protein